MAYLLYVAVKLLFYIAWCWVGLRLWRTASPGLMAPGIFGILRLTIGIAFGVAIFLMVPTQREDVIWKYLVIYTPVRMVEWFIMALIIGRTVERRTTVSTILWCFGGIVVSFAADFASPEGVAGHFCVGRCLC